MIEDSAIRHSIEREIKLRFGKQVYVKDSDHLENDLGVDSLDRVEIWLALENDFKVDIPENEAKTIETVMDCINLVKKYSKG